MESNEDLLRDALVEECRVQFDLTEEWQIVPYFMFRHYLTAYPSKKKNLPAIDWEVLASFMLKELGCAVINGCLTVQEDTFSAKAGYGNALRLIMEDWWFQTQRHKNWSEKEWKKAYEDLIGQVRSHVRLKTSHPLFSETIKQRGFNLLEAYFNARPTGAVADALLLVPEALYLPSQEERTERLILHFNQLLHITHDVSEEMLEKYLIKHINLIDDTLKVVDTQVNLPNGRIDILARTQEKQDVIIEVKTEKDTDIIWQRMYYQSEWEKQHHSPKMVIVTSTPLDDSIKDMLRKVGQTTVYEVKVYVRNGKIEKVTVESCYILEPEGAKQPL